MTRSLFVAAMFFTMTPLLIVLQGLLKRLGVRGWGSIGVRYYRALAAVLRIRVHVVGAPMRDRAVLFISNHVSWADIVVIGSIVPIAYVAKSEIAKWPLVGTAAKSQRTIFVDRSRASRPATLSPISCSGSPPVPRSCCLPKAHRATATACCRSVRR
ncbi:MAG: lysophospholipid acyltransferase family protein [Pseudolabrys sp.]